MKITDRFKSRKDELKKVFKKDLLVQLWRSEVRQQLRDQPIKDLHDYYDFNYNIEHRADLVVKLILSGAYKTSSPLIYRHEKKLGISRHLMIPVPSDVLVFQAIVNKISKNLSKKNPTKKSFYSRSKNSKLLPHEVKLSDDYLGWTKLWKKYQEEIYKFSKQKKFLVVTDIANYFDSILLRDLRGVIASRLNANEAFLDLLFNLIEQLSWNPDYLPVSLRGLPTIGIDAPRLLAHVYLFEIDVIIDKKTKGSFVRWMDDINFGVNDIEEGKRILGSLSDVLKGRGLALNLSKTRIYTSDEAMNHFLFNENKTIDGYYNNKGVKKNTRRKANVIEAKFKTFLNKSDCRNWDRIIKRYYTLFGDMKSKRLLKYSKLLFTSHPSIREYILRYVGKLGFNNSTVRLINILISDVSYHDDVTQYQIVKTITDWKMPINEDSKKFIRNVARSIREKNDEFSIYCYLWFGAKYLPPKTLFDYINSKQSIIKHEPFLCRQVTSIIPRLYPYDRDFCNAFLKEHAKSSLPDVASVANNLIFILNSDEVKDKKINFYLYPTNIQSPYPLPKYLILYAHVCSSGSDGLDKKKNEKIRSHIDDPWFEYWLTEYFDDFK